MKNVKNFFFVALVLLIGFSSCTKEEDCVAPALSSNIVGTWLLNGGDGNTFEFKSDGTLIDANDEIIGIEVNGVNYSEKTYTVVNDTLTLVATNPNDNTQRSTATIPVTDNECDEITLSIVGFSTVMERQ